MGKKVSDEEYFPTAQNYYLVGWGNCPLSPCHDATGWCHAKDWTYQVTDESNSSKTVKRKCAETLASLQLVTRHKCTQQLVQTMEPNAMLQSQYNTPVWVRGCAGLEYTHSVSWPEAPKPGF